MTSRIRRACAAIAAVALFAASAGAAMAQELSSPDTRLTIGMEQSGGSSSARATTFLLDFMLTAPLGPLRGDATAEPRRYPWASAWLNTRLSGMPQETNAAVKQFVGGFESALIGGKTSDLLAGVSLVGGVEINAFGNGREFVNNRAYKFHPMVIVGAGFTSTADPRQGLPTFELTDEARQRFGVPADTGERKYKHIAFAQPERDTFFGQWYVGLRLKTHYYETAQTTEEGRFPGLIDVSFGQNAAVSGGQLVGGLKVMRIEAFYPLPSDTRGLKSIYFFGTAFKHLTRGVESSAVILKGSKVEVPAPDVYVHTLSSGERRRDFWSFGVGMDLISLVRPNAPK